MGDPGDAIFIEEVSDPIFDPLERDVEAPSADVETELSIIIRAGGAAEAVFSHRISEFEIA